MIDAKPFLSDSRSSAVAAGMTGLRIVALSVAQTQGLPSQDLERTAKESVDEIIDVLTKGVPAERPQSPSAPKRAEVLSFTGREYREALDDMEKSFLGNL